MNVSRYESVQAYQDSIYIVYFVLKKANVVQLCKPFECIYWIPDFILHGMMSDSYYNISLLGFKIKEWKFWFTFKSEENLIVQYCLQGTDFFKRAPSGKHVYTKCPVTNKAGKGYSMCFALTLLGLAVLVMKHINDTDSITG